MHLGMDVYAWERMGSVYSSVCSGREHAYKC